MERVSPTVPRRRQPGRRPDRIGAGGVEKIVEIELDAEAQKNFTVSVDAVKELLVACKAIDGSLN